MKTSEASGFLIFYNFHITSKGKIALKWVNLKHCVKRVRIRRYSGPHFSRIFLHSDWIRSDTPYLSVFSPNAGKCGENADQNNSKYGHFLRSESTSFYVVHSTSLSVNLTCRLIIDSKWIILRLLQFYPSKSNNFTAFKTFTVARPPLLLDNRVRICSGNSYEKQSF